MDAQVGDQLVVSSRRVGAAPQHGEITEVIMSGGLHFRVRWGDGRESIVFPGTDATIRRGAALDAAPSSMGPRTASIDLHLEEDGDQCESQASMRTSIGTFTGVGKARRNPIDPLVPMIGEELAIARSLSDLAVQLERAALAAMPAGFGASSHLVP